MIQIVLIDKIIGETHMSIEFDSDVMNQLTMLRHQSSAKKEIPEQKVKADINRLLQNKEVKKAMTLLAAE